VNLFDPCGQQVVRFRVKITTAVSGGDTGAAGESGTETLVEQVVLEKSGELVSSQVNPADPKGFFVAEYTF
jgi:hypothetical protein